MIIDQAAGWLLVKCDGCSKPPYIVGMELKIHYHVFGNLEYLEWCYEKRLAL